MHRFTIIEQIAVFSTIPILPDIGYASRPQVSPKRELAEKEALDASAMTYRSWSPMESGTVNDMMRVGSSVRLQDDTSPKSAVGRRWPVGPSLMTAEAVNGGRHRKAEAAAAASLS